MEKDEIIIEENSKSLEYKKLDAIQKGQFTKNFILLSTAGSENIHQNKRNLESVLNIKNKGTSEVYAKLSHKTYEEIIKEFPKFTNQNLLDFIKN